MGKEQLKELLDKMGKHIPLCKIELYLKMPKNTLQKALSEKEKTPRKLPKRWVIPITEFVNFKKYITMDNINPSNTKIKDVGSFITTKSISEAKPSQKEETPTVEAESGVKLSSFELYKRKKLGLK